MKGRQEGQAGGAGMQEGRREGKQKGIQEGMQEGRQEGVQEGRQEGIIELAANLERPGKFGFRSAIESCSRWLSTFSPNLSLIRIFR